MFKGKQGDWFVTVEHTGERLPCIDSHCWSQGGYTRSSPAFKLSSPKFQKYLEALKAGRAVVAVYDWLGAGPQKRVGYKGVVQIVDVTYDFEEATGNGTIRFRSKAAVGVAA